MAGRCTDDVPPAGFEVPEEWEFVSEIKKNGSLVKDFQAPTSVTFGAKRQSHLQAASPSNKKHALRSIGRRGGLTSTRKERTNSEKQQEIENTSDIECASALLDLSIDTQNEVLGGASALLEILAQPTENIECRTSRRLAGLKLELQTDFIFNRALEYIIKDKPRP